jgi:tRNA(fMet)-specific endonuclease VapC
MFILDTDHLGILQGHRGEDCSKRKRVRVATMDLRIASIAISQHMTFITRNTVDYERIPGLIVQDWTIPIS